MSRNEHHQPCIASAVRRALGRSSLLASATGIALGVAACGSSSSHTSVSAKLAAATTKVSTQSGSAPLD
jgi:hypothetical protein